TTLRYELPAATTVALTVRNVLGQAVLTLPATRETVGSHTRELPLNGLAAGIYLVQLRAGDLVQTQRLVVE
ncbi:T9SS type A sorting domain-containing protein, partial [Hymenobacter agri]